MRPAYLVAEYKRIEEVAEKITRAREMVEWYERQAVTFHRTYDTPMGITDEGVYFIEVREAQYDSGWAVDQSKIVTWADIANHEAVLADLQRREGEAKKAHEKHLRDNRREQYERLQREFGGR